MDLANLLSKFDELLSTIQSLVSECKAERKVEPAIRLLVRWKTDEVVTTDTGVAPSGAHLEYIEKEDWLRAEQSLLELLKTHRTYSGFRDILAERVGRDVAKELERAVSTLIGSTFDGRVVDAKEALGFLLGALSGEPVLAWSDTQQGYSPQSSRRG